MSGRSAGYWLRALAAIWRLGVAEATAYRVALFVWVLTSTFPLISLALWAGIARSAPVGDFTQADFVAYFVGAFLVRQLTASWVVWDLERQISTGELNTLLLRPVHPLLHHLMTNLAALPLRTALAAPIGVLVIVFAGGAVFGGSLGELALLPVALVGAWLINFCVQVMIGSLAFWITSSSALYEVWVTCYVVLSGYAVPTSLLPAGLTTVVRFLPFHAGLGFPVELLMGRLSPRELLIGFAVQWSWVLVLMLGARVTWRRGVRVYGAVGA